MIPFNKPYIAKNEFDYIRQAIESCHTAGDGVFTIKCNQFLESTFNVPKALLTTNCTHALEMAALLLDLKDGDEVITPSFTFVSTVNAFALRGARPHFVDIRPDTLNIDEKLIESAINSRTKAIFVMHYAGVGCEMDEILRIAREHDLPVVEDNAHGLFGKYKGRYLGTFGQIATQSFHETKNFSCGEGGALLINDPSYAERAEIIREKGTNRSRFFRGQIDKYTWVDVGSSYLPSEILAGVLFSHFEEADFIQNKRKQVWETYQKHLQGWAGENDVCLPFVPDYCEQSYHMYYMLMPNLDTRGAFIQFLKSRDILSVFHYVPLHTADMGRFYGYQTGDLPMTETYSDRLVRLPFYNSLSDDEQSRVIQAVLDFKV